MLRAPYYGMLFIQMALSGLPKLDVVGGAEGTRRAMRAGREGAARPAKAGCGGLGVGDRVDRGKGVAEGEGYAETGSGGLADGKAEGGRGSGIRGGRLWVGRRFGSEGALRLAKAGNNELGCEKGWGKGEAVIY